MLENTENFWEESWIKHIDSYLKATSRAGIFISQYFKNTKKILEIAGGSCRDSRYLANNGYDATGSDFDNKTLKYLQVVKFPHDVLKYSKEDAFNLSFKDSSFDMVFHNGFFVLFTNEDIYKMLKEQERVAVKYIVFFVHNKENKSLVDQFSQKIKDDSLYDIRFFDKNEIEEIVKVSGINYHSIKLLKFGGRSDVFYNKILKRYIPNILYPFSKYLIPKLYQLQEWENTERICCVIELDK